MEFRRKQPLEAMMEMQDNLQKELGYNIKAMTPKERTKYIKEYALHANVELGEMLRELPYFKPWKIYEDTEDLTLAKEEFIDVMHFMLTIALALGFTDIEMANMYYAKHTVNKDRQKKPEYKKCVDNLEVTEDGDRV